MKKILSLFFVTCLLCFSLISCVNKNNDLNNIPESNSNTNTQDEDKTTPNSNISSSTNTPNIQTKTCRLYFYDFDTEEIIFIDKEIEITDKALVKALISAHKDGINDKNVIKLHEAAQVKSAKLEDDILKVHFNKEFQTKMNLGSCTEAGLIQSLVNTLGYNYNVKKVAFYVDNELYFGIYGPNQNGYFTTSY